MSEMTTEVARVLEEHGIAQVSNHVVMGVIVCRCSHRVQTTPDEMWAEHATHQADELAKAGLLRPQDGAQAAQDGANGGDVGSGKGEGVSTPQTGAQAPGEGEA